MATTTWLGCIVVAVCLVHSVNSRAARLPLDDATRRALDRLTLYLEEMGQNAASHDGAPQYRDGFDLGKHIPRESTSGQGYRVELPREDNYRRSQFDPQPAGSRSLPPSHYPQPPLRLPTANVGTFLEYLESALHTDSNGFGKHSLSANKRQPPSGFHAVRGKRSVHS